MLAFPFLKNRYNRNTGESLDFYLSQNCYNSQAKISRALFQKGENTMKTFIHNNSYVILICVLSALGTFLVGTTL